MAPYDDPSWDIWCCSGGNSQQAAPPRINEWYEIHSIVDLHAPENKGWYPPYVAWLNAQKFPVWMQEKNDDIPRASVFPRRELMARFGPTKTKTNWFTSTPAWMFAHAIVRGYTTIGIFGVDMAAAEEHYTGQKAGLLRWFEIGRELGINVVVPLESSLAFHYPLYGYAESSRMGRHLLVRETETKAQIAHWQNQEMQIKQRIFALSGTLEQLTFDRRTFVSGIDDADISDEEMRFTARLPVSSDPPEVAQPTQMTSPSAQAVSLTSTGSLQILNNSSRTPTAADFADNPDAALLMPRNKANGPMPKEQE
jgi:hypothetical protein